MFEPEQTPQNSFSKPPKELFKGILKRLKIERLLAVFRKKFSIYSIILVLSAILIISTFIIFQPDLRNSESGPFFILIFSDTFKIVMLLKYFTVAFLESIPVFFLAIIFLAIAILMISLRLAVEYYGKILELISKKN